MALAHWMYFTMWPSVNHGKLPTDQILISGELRCHTFGCIYSDCCGRKDNVFLEVDIDMMEANKHF